MQEESSLNFADRFTRAIARAGVKPARISEITGISKGYLSDLLSGKKSGPSPEYGKKLADVLCVSPEWLMLGASNGIAESSAKPKEADADKGTPAHFRNSQIGSRGAKIIPVVGWAHAGEAENYEELPQDWQISLPTDCPDRHAFAVILEGDSMEPKFSEGDWIIVQPSEFAYSGCLVVARFSNDGIIFRRMERNGDEIILKPLNDGWPITRHRPEDFTWIYPVWGRFTPIWRKR